MRVFGLIQEQITDYYWKTIYEECVELEMLIGHYVL